MSCIYHIRERFQVGLIKRLVSQGAEIGQTLLQQSGTQVTCIMPGWT
jgi:hypothetical protein